MGGRRSQLRVVVKETGLNPLNRICMIELSLHLSWQLIYQLLLSAK
jgi:hypothetical protein